ncbi:hypothetical protein EC968_009322 [Mortierella alpina]|nr:hypothetical protein EC968_009322 [Mortierella alpina]
MSVTILLYTSALLMLATLLQASLLPISKPLSDPVVPLNEPSLELKRVKVKAKSGLNVITSCDQPNTLAITFDDGPFDYTGELLDLLNRENIKATFFMNGKNIGDITEFESVVKRAFDEGHHVASHTWDHKDLSQMSEGGVRREMTRLDETFLRILGVRPVYMRPPFGYLNSAAEHYLASNGYKVVTWSIDTNDWRHPRDIQASMEFYRDQLSDSDAHGRGFIALQHDTKADTVRRLVPAVIKYARQQGFEMVTVGACLGDPQSNWYRA